MDTVDLTPTPAACRQIARLFRAQQAHAEGMIGRASRALDALDGLDDDDDALAPWGRALLAAAFGALDTSERARVRAMQDGLDALGPDASDDTDRGEGPDDATQPT